MRSFPRPQLRRADRYPVGSPGVAACSKNPQSMVRSVLAAKFESGNSLRPQLRPQLAFYLRRLGTKASAAFARRFIAGNRFESRTVGGRAESGCRTAPISPFQV